MLISAAIFLGLVVAGRLTAMGFLGCMLIFLFGSGIASPPAMIEAMSVNPAAAGSASGLYGSLQMANGAVCATLAGLGTNHALSAAIVLFTTSVLATILFWTAGWLEKKRITVSG